MAKKLYNERQLRKGSSAHVSTANPKEFFKHLTTLVLPHPPQDPHSQASLPPSRPLPALSESPCRLRDLETELAEEEERGGIKVVVEEIEEEEETEATTPAWEDREEEVSPIFPIIPCTGACSLDSELLLSNLESSCDAVHHQSLNLVSLGSILERQDASLDGMEVLSAQKPKHCVRFCFSSVAGTPQLQAFHSENQLFHSMKELLICVIRMNHSNLVWGLCHCGLFPHPCSGVFGGELISRVDGSSVGRKTV
eukprot:XP_013992146.1 PREDICTED: uncharacterized protein LOC106567430 [Salmo salar]